MKKSAQEKYLTSDEFEIFKKDEFSVFRNEFNVFRKDEFNTFRDEFNVFRRDEFNTFRDEFKAFRKDEFNTFRDEFKTSMEKIDARFDSMYDELCKFIRDTAEEQRVLLWKDFDEKHYREIGAISESYDDKIKAMGEGTVFISEKFDRLYLQLKTESDAIYNRVSRIEAVVY